MADTTTVAGRIEAAYYARISQIRRRYTLSDFGRDVADKEGREKGYTPSTVQDWFAARSEPKVATLAAIAAVVGCTPEWVAFHRGAPPAGFVEGPSPDDDEAPTMPLDAFLRAETEDNGKDARPTPKRESGPVRRRSRGA